jgi:hypothetical protein
MHGRITLGLFLIGLTLPGGVAARADGLGGCLSETNRLITFGSGCLDNERGVVWGFRAPERMTQDEAGRFCGAMNPIASAEGNVTAWSLPTLNDIRALTTIPELNAFMDFPVHDFYWTSNHDAGYGATAIPATGERAVVKTTEMIAAVCVARVAGCAQETDRFRSGFGGCVDKADGYVWGPMQKAGMTHTGAANFCLKSNQFGFSDWEMPSESLVKSMSEQGLLMRLYPSLRSAGLFWAGEDGRFWRNNIFAYGYPGMLGPAFACVRKASGETDK